MSLFFCEAVDDIRGAAIEHRLHGPRNEFLWATIVAQFSEQNSCDGSLAELLLEIIRSYLKKPSDGDIIAIWLETETGGGDDPEELFPDSVRIDLEMELLDELTNLAWGEATRKRKRK